MRRRLLQLANLDQMPHVMTATELLELVPNLTHVDVEVLSGDHAVNLLSDQFRTVDLLPLHVPRRDDPQREQHPADGDRRRSNLQDKLIVHGAGAYRADGQR